MDATTPSPFGVTMDDVAARAGVSRATVSRVLGGRVAVSTKATEKVLRAIHELGYVPNMAASQLASGASSVVGLLLRDPRNPAYGLLHSHLQQATFDEDLQLVTVVPSVGQRAEFEASSLQRLLGLRVGGLFVATGVVPSAELLPFVSAVPVVSVGRIETHPRIYAVSYDESSNGAQLADLVFAYGHRRVAVLIPNVDVSVGENRRGVVMAARLRERGAEVVELAAHEFGVRGGRDDDAIRLVREGRVTAVMFPTDLRAMHFLEIAARAGVRVPDDVSVTGCDGVAFGLPLMGLATVRVPVESVARRGVQVMRQLIDAPGSLEVRHELHSGVLIDGPTLSVPSAAASSH